MLPHATRKDPRLQHSNEQLGHAIAIMPARIEKNKNFMNVTNRVLQCCAVVKNYGRKNAKLAWTTPFVPDTFIVPISRGTQRRPWTAAPRDLRFQIKRVSLFKV